jgi:hypothetical protein
MSGMPRNGRSPVEARLQTPGSIQRLSDVPPIDLLSGRVPTWQHVNGTSTSAVGATSARRSVAGSGVMSLAHYGAPIGRRVRRAGASAVIGRGHGGRWQAGVAPGLLL